MKKKKLKNPVFNYQKSKYKIDFLRNFYPKRLDFWSLGILGSLPSSSSGFGACSEKKIGLSCCQRTCWCGNWLYRALRSWCHFPRRITDIEVGKLLKNRPQPQPSRRNLVSTAATNANDTSHQCMHTQTPPLLFGKKAKKKILKR